MALLNPVAVVRCHGCMFGGEKMVGVFEAWCQVRFGGDEMEKINDNTAFVIFGLSRSGLAW